MKSWGERKPWRFWESPNTVPRVWLDQQMETTGRERAARKRAEALASKLADALERERERYHALASSLVPKAASTPVSDEAIAHLMTRADQGIPLAIMHALDNVAPGSSDPRLRAHLYQWAMQPEQRERMQTPTGLAGVVDEIVRGKQRSA